MPTQIKDLTQQTSPATADRLPIQEASGDLTKHATLADLFDAARDRARWLPIDASRYTATPASTSRITMSDTSGLSVGLPIRYTYGGTTYYGRIKTVSTNAHIDVQGAPLDTGQDLTALEVGRPELVVVRRWTIPGTYADGVADLLAADANEADEWEHPTGHLVHARAWHKTADSSTTEPTVNVKVGGSRVLTGNGGAGIAMGGAEAWQDNGDVAIDTATYQVARDDALEVECSSAGGTGDASDLTVLAVFVVA